MQLLPVVDESEGGLPGGDRLGRREREIARFHGDDGNLERGFGARVVKARRREEYGGADEQRDRDDFQHGAPRGREGSDNMATPEGRREGRDVAVPSRRAWPFLAQALVLYERRARRLFESDFRCAAFGRGHPLRAERLDWPASRPANLRTPPSADARAPHAWGYETRRVARRTPHWRNAATEPSRPRTGTGRRGPDRTHQGWTPSSLGSGVRRRLGCALLRARRGCPREIARPRAFPEEAAYGRSKRLAAVSRGSQRVSPSATTQGMLAADRREEVSPTKARRAQAARRADRRSAQPRPRARHLRARAAAAAPSPSRVPSAPARA